ncbi:MAG: signal transduction histidine kinase [uncultured bacterium]|nr:MAG: signal transduction histidine kinase [uncultured bacterium]
MYRMNEVTNNTELKRVYSDSLKNNDIHVNVSKNEDELYGYLLLKDIDNKPIAIIKGIMTRAIYQSGITTITYFNYIFFGFGTIFVIVLSYLLRRIVITRLEKLNKAIINIEAKKELSLRVNEEGEDEITSVEKETNKMLSTIEEYSDQQKILLNKISTELDNVNKFSKKLQETETLLRDTINFMPSMLIILGKDLTITQLNSLSQQSLGKNIDDLKGKSVFEIYPFLVNYKEKILNALEKKSPETVERIEHQHGDAAHYYKLVIFPLSFPEKDQCLAIKIDDITDYVVLEDKIRQNDKLSSIGVLTAGIAHEIINPINYVESVIPLLKNNISYFIDTFNQLSTMKSDSDNTKQFDQLVTVAKYNEIDNKLNETNQLLDKVKASADKTDEIVKNLKSFVRMDENIKKKVNIHDGINSTVNILKYKCGDRISLIKEYSDIPEIECIPGKLNQVFMTIIFNAIDAIPNKGDIIIKTSQDKDNVIISIKDNGKGISDENKKKIFQPFFTTKKADSGTGLGLAISREIIQELRGSINFKSELGIGTEFIITLPKKAEYVTS